MFGIGQPELIVIVFILLLFFGPSSLPKLSKSLGESIKTLKDGFTDGKSNQSLKDITEEVGKDITKEVSNSAHEIKKAVTEVKNTASINEHIMPQQKDT